MHFYISLQVMSNDPTIISSLLEEASFERRDGLALEIEVLDSQTLLGPPFAQKTVTPTRTHFHTLLLIAGEQSSHFVDFKRSTVNAGDLLIIPQGYVQSFDKSRNLRGQMVLFTSRFLDQCQIDIRELKDCAESLLSKYRQLHLARESAQQLERCIESLKTATATAIDRPFAQNAISSAFSSLIFTLAGFPETNIEIIDAPQDELVVAFLQLLETNFRKNHLASTYAKSLGVSLRTLDRRLVASQRQTSRRLISARLLLEAKRLLTIRDSTIKEIAYGLGFSEPQNFSRFFQSHTDLSPQHFRQKLDI